MHARFKSFAERILAGNRTVLVITLWTAVIAFTIIEVFWLKYETTARLAAYDIVYTRYDAPALQAWDVLILIVASLMITLLAYTPRDLVYGYLGSLFLSFCIGVVYVFLYIWFVQGHGAYFSINPFDWELPLFYAIINVFRIMFPSVIATCLIGLAIGVLLRGLFPNRFQSG